MRAKLSPRRAPRRPLHPGDGLEARRQSTTAAKLAGPPKPCQGGNAGTGRVSAPFGRSACAIRSSPRFPTGYRPGRRFRRPVRGLAFVAPFTPGSLRSPRALFRRPLRGLPGFFEGPSLYHAFCEMRAEARLRSSQSSRSRCIAWFSPLSAPTVFLNHLKGVVE